MFFRNKPQACAYNKENQRPVIRSGICTGEKVAGFQDIHSGRFTEVMLLRTPKDLETFRWLYGIGEDEIETVY